MHPSAHPRRPWSAGLRQSVFAIALGVVVIGLSRRPAPDSPAIAKHPAPSLPRAIPLVPRQETLPASADQSAPSASPSREIDAALALPPGPDRDTAFTSALERWILNDPDAAAVRIARLTDPRDFDRAAALLVIRTDALHRTTATALAWAEDLADPALRRRALVHVLREWAQQDPAAALRYAETAPSLTDQRSAVLAALLPPIPET